MFTSPHSPDEVRVDPQREVTRGVGHLEEAGHVLDWRDLHGKVAQNVRHLKNRKPRHAALNRLPVAVVDEERDQAQVEQHKQTHVETFFYHFNGVRSHDGG